MDKAPFAELSKGSLLVASPDINSGIYFRSIILICEHAASGSFGLIINKPVSIDLPSDMIDLNNQPNTHIGVRAGGPIQPNQMMLLHSDQNMGGQALKVLEGVYLGGDMRFLQHALSDANGPHLLLCFGYTGWDSGMLEREFLGGNWFLAPGSSRIVFETPPEKMWQTVLREMGGKYATLSMIPEDLSLN